MGKIYLSRLETAGDEKTSEASTRLVPPLLRWEGGNTSVSCTQIGQESQYSWAPKKSNLRRFRSASGFCNTNAAIEVQHGFSRKVPDQNCWVKQMIPPVHSCKIQSESKLEWKVGYNHDVDLGGFVEKVRIVPSCPLHPTGGGEAEHTIALETWLCAYLEHLFFRNWRWFCHFYF